MDNYREQAIEKSNPEFNRLIKSNPDLTNDQKLKLSKIIYSYHLNQILTSSYLSFDSNLQKTKLGVIKFNFEKEFASICKEYNIKTTEPTESNPTNFQWD